LRRDAAATLGNGVSLSLLRPVHGPGGYP
jgi:hypothetical protein